MELSRRHFSVLSASFLAAAILDRRVRAHPIAPGRTDPTWFEWKRVADGAWVGLGEGGNSLVIADAGEWILVDTKNPGFGETLRREGAAQVAQAGAAGSGGGGDAAGDRAEGRLVRVINTHHHADHTGGNYAFAGVAPVLAHVNAPPRVLLHLERYKERLKALPAQVAKSNKPGAQQIIDEISPLVDQLDTLDAARFAPTETVGMESELKVGARRISLHHYGPGHTDNDLIVHLPDLNLVHTGDLLFNARHPFVDAPAGATSTGWVASLNRIIELCDDRTTVVPGHGAVTDVEGLRTQIRYFEAARDGVRRAIDQGAGRDAALEVQIEGFSAYGDQGKGRVLGALYDELKPSSPK